MDIVHFLLDFDGDKCELVGFLIKFKIDKK